LIRIDVVNKNCHIKLKINFLVTIVKVLGMFIVYRGISLFLLATANTIEVKRLSLHYQKAGMNKQANSNM
jgi:hypothetical protein